MCHSSFIKTSRAMTIFDQKSFEVIDHASGILMHGRMKPMREIVNKITMELDRLDSKKLTCQLEHFLEMRTSKT